MTRKNRVESLSLFLLIMLVITIFAPMLRHSINERTADYPNHIRRGITLYERGTIEIPHVVFAYSVMVTHALLRLHWAAAGFLVALVAYIALGIVLYRLYIRPLFGSRSHLGLSVVAIVLTLMLMLMSAVNLFTWSDSNLYFGYIMPSVYHSPTMTTMKPFSAAVFVLACGVFVNAERFNRPSVLVITALVTAIGCAAKPVYLMTLLPALALVTLYFIARKQYINWRLLLGGIVIPAGIVLTIQIFVLPNAQGGQFVVNPLGFYREIDAVIGARKGYSVLDSLPFTLLLSLLFPLTVYGVYFNKARRDLSLNLAWLSLFFGTVYLLFLVEGDRPQHGNFTWSAHSAAFILFAATLVFFIRQIYSSETGLQKLNPASLACTLTLSLHIVSGFVWYFSEISSPVITWW
jgi:hypothetical protein